ncbi:hypothetical protein GCM10011344_22920 [Dokdonia pacifica]|uniref:DUF1761 domain-containing protein n=1 Tax=Dokdonia pacifica TaxID=1627892 RepID=A0A238WIR6_9FLAO|nr:DUF1761 domain-containing protein [Dokdonia pacifica]GGG21536.1 hypothetical protein GCM10011344_22920 [Dokdonia pacifica]SNR46455.1 Protein of unknown function [Dokdonia pacifica]
MGDYDINWIALLVAAASSLVVGFVWYGPLFGKAWMKESGMTEEKVKEGNMALIFGLSFIFACFLSFTMWAQVMIGGGGGEIHGQEPFLTFKHGAFHGTLMGLFVILPVLGTIALYERKSIKYVLIAAGYWTVTLAIMGGIINAWI